MLLKYFNEILKLHTLSKARYCHIKIYKNTAETF